MRSVSFNSGPIRKVSVVVLAVAIIPSQVIYCECTVISYHNPKYTNLLTNSTHGDNYLEIYRSLGSYLRSTKYDSQIAIQASYLNYYCGELCIALKVETVSNDELSGIIGLPVYPYKNNENIENYIAENLEHNQGLFCLKGNLHKWNKGFLRLFIVGSEGYPMEVSSIEKLQPGQDCNIG